MHIKTLEQGRKRQSFRASRQQCLDVAMMLEERNDIPERDRIILEESFLKGKTIREISETCNLPSRMHGRSLGPSMIVYIIRKYVPDWEKREPTPSNGRMPVNKLDKLIIAPHRCAFCDSTEHLERHHMIPLFLGGTDASENIIYVCEEHHKIITAYQRKTFKNW